MTTDLIKDMQAGAMRPESTTALRHILRRPSTLRSTPVLERARASLADDMLHDGTNRMVSNMIALLEYANRLIEAAETQINQQEERIQSLLALSVTDELTGLRNRRGFYESFMAELDRCTRKQSVGGLLVLIDLDNFKTINDTHGHPAGDACLRLVARTIADQVRAMDTCARLGGDEFVILLSNTTKEDAARRAQTLAWQLNNLALAWNGEEIPVRASLGLKSFGAGDNADKVFSEADLELYAAKSFRSRSRRADQSGRGTDIHHDATQHANTPSREEECHAPA